MGNTFRAKYWYRNQQYFSQVGLSLTSLIYLFYCFSQENKIKEELEKKIDKLREQADVNKQEIEQGKIKIDEVISL